MDFETSGVNAIAIIPQTIMLVMSLFSIYAMHIGNYQPPARVWQGLGGAIYILGFGLYIAFDPVGADQIGRGLMWVGVTINFMPRFMVTSGDFKWMVRNNGLKKTLLQVIHIRDGKRAVK